MKIGLARRGYSATGGAEAYLRRFARAAGDGGDECVLFASKEWPRKDWAGELLRVKNGKSPLDFALALSNLRPREHCDFFFSLERVLACDCYRAGDGVHGAWLERREQLEPRWKSWLWRKSGKHHELLRLEETLFRGEAARTVIANSRMVKEEIVRHYGYPAERIGVIYNGVPAALPPEEAEAARARLRQELGLADDAYVLLFAGSGWSRKGLRYAIDAVNHRPVGNPHLIVAGRGSRFRMPRSAHVTYLGPVPNLGPVLAAADLFVLPTLYDPFSNASLEALAAGLPVITTASNGFHELIEPGVDGDFISHPRDVAGLVGCLAKWAGRERREAGRFARREKGARFTVERNLAETRAWLLKGAV